MEHPSSQWFIANEEAKAEPPNPINGAYKGVANHSVVKA